LFQALGSQVVMSRRGRGYGHGVDLGEQRLPVEKVGGFVPLSNLASTLFVQISHAGEFDAGQVGTDTAVSLAHDSGADDAYAYNLHRIPP
jgi:hypothetical protein